MASPPFSIDSTKSIWGSGLIKEMKEKKGGVISDYIFYFILLFYSPLS